MANQLKRESTIGELLSKIYEDNYSHIDFMENMGGGDCDCLIHKVANFIFKELGEEEQD